MPERPGSSDLAILAVAGALMVMLASVSFLIAPVDSSPRVPGSSYSAHQDGTKAAYIVLKELGHDIDRSFEPIAELDGDPADTILVLANPAAAPSKQDERALRSFVEGGGIVLAFGRSAGPFLPGVKLVGAEESSDDVRTFTARLSSRLTRAAPEVSARSGGSVPKLDPAYMPVYGPVAGEPAVVAASFGHGQIVWSLDHTPIENEGIARANNVRLLANAAGPVGERFVLWDEHYHGERRSLWSYVAATPLTWGFAQLGLVALAGLAAVSRRRGPLRARPIEPRTSPLEFIDTMGSLYERAGVSSAAVEAARARLRRRLASTAGLPTSATDAQLGEAAALRGGVDADRTTAAFSAAAEALRRPSGRVEEMIGVVGELQDLTARVGAARGGVVRGGDESTPDGQHPTSKSLNVQLPTSNLQPPG